MKVVFIFCEGAHDIALLDRLLPRLPGVTRSKRKLKDYPTPFNNFWKAQLGTVVARMETRPAEHRGKLVPPWLEVAFESDSVLYLVFSMGGKDQRGPISKVLKDWMSVYANPFGTPPAITAWAVLFVIDADDAGVNARRGDLFQWLVAERLIDVPPENDKNWVTSGGYAAGCFVVHGPDSPEGSIEDHWIPIADKAVGPRMRDARSFVEAHRLDGADVNKRGHLHKAELTIAGQIEFPGCSLAVILRDTQWTTDEEFEATAIGKELFGFFGTIPV